MLAPMASGTHGMQWKDGLVIAGSANHSELPEWDAKSLCLGS